MTILQITTPDHTLTISAPTGNTGSLHVMKDNWYHGKIVRMNGQWTAYLSENTDITGDDLGVLVGMVEEIMDA